MLTAVTVVQSVLTNQNSDLKSVCKSSEHYPSVFPLFQKYCGNYSEIFEIFKIFKNYQISELNFKKKKNSTNVFQISVCTTSVYSIEQLPCRQGNQGLFCCRCRCWTKLGQQSNLSKRLRGDRLINCVFIIWIQLALCDEIWV